MSRAAREVLDALRRLDVTHVTGIPDNASAPLFGLLPAGAGSSRGAPRLVPVTREGEAIALAAGLWIGGARPLVAIQSTGLLEAGDALRGTAVRMGAPVPLLVTGRGYATLARAGLGTGEELTPGLLRRPDVDSTALLAERTLAAWGVPYERCDEAAAAAGSLAATIERARTAGHPAALLLTASLA